MPLPVGVCPAAGEAPVIRSGSEPEERDDDPFEVVYYRVAE